jgi:hypothetical protein
VRAKTCISEIFSKPNPKVWDFQGVRPPAPLELSCESPRGLPRIALVLSPKRPRPSCGVRLKFYAALGDFAYRKHDLGPNIYSGRSPSCSSRLTASLRAQAYRGEGELLGLPSNSVRLRPSNPDQWFPASQSARLAQGRRPSGKGDDESRNTTRSFRTRYPASETQWIVLIQHPSLQS